MSVHPQVAVLLERVARSPLPPYPTVPPFVARRIYRDTRGALDSAHAAVADCCERLRGAFAAAPRAAHSKDVAA